MRYLNAAEDELIVGDVIASSLNDNEWIGYIVKTNAGEIEVEAHYFYYMSDEKKVFLAFSKPYDITIEDVIHGIEKPNLIIKEDRWYIYNNREVERTRPAVEFYMTVTAGEMLGKDVVVRRVISGVKYHAPDFLLCTTSDNKVVLLLSDMVELYRRPKKDKDRKDWDAKYFEDCVNIYTREYAKKLEIYMQGKMDQYDLVEWRISSRERLEEVRAGLLSMEDFYKAIQ